MAEPAASAQNAQQGNRVRVVQVRRRDLPLSCPRPDAELWSLHPRVYLAIEKTGAAVCPYCGAHYELID